MKRRLVLLAAAAVSSALAGCGAGGEDGTPAAATGSPSPRPAASADPAPTSSASPVPAVSPRPSASTLGAGGDAEDRDAPVAFPANADADVAEPSGGPLSVRAVRVARQQGYDRVVFELAGRDPGQAGWRVEYVDTPTEQGTGDPVDVQGEAVLSVLITGTGYPMDTGVEEVDDDPALPPGPGVVQDVVLGAVFEGQYEAFIGTASRQPFRVFRLGDPERVVVDVRTR